MEAVRDLNALLGGIPCAEHIIEYEDFKRSARLGRHHEQLFNLDIAD